MVGAWIVSIFAAGHSVHLNVVVVDSIGESLLASMAFGGCLFTTTYALDTTNLVHVSRDLVPQGHEMITPDSPPPGRLVDNAKFTIESLATDTSLADDVLILVGAGESIDGLDVQDQEGWAITPAEDDRYIAVELDYRILKLPADESLIGNGGEAQWKDQVEPEGDRPCKANSSVKHTTVTSAVVLDGMAQRKDGGQPGDEKAKGGNLEANAVSAGNGFLEGLLGGTLHLSEGPASRNDHEEVLYLGSAIVL